MSKIAVVVNCPHCNASLMDEKHLINNKPGILLHLKTKDGKKGIVRLSSIYGDYNYSANILIPTGEVVDFFCPHCKKNLNRKKVDCDTCGAPIVSFNCDIGGRISICSRNGCKNHYVAFEDPDLLAKKFFTEYGFH
jgi:hypothetical protein